MTSRPPKWIKPQVTRLVEEAPTGSDWLHEIKYDGYRMHARIDGGQIKLLTRTGWLQVGAHEGPNGSRLRCRYSVVASRSHAARSECLCIGGSHWASAERCGCHLCVALAFVSVPLIVAL
jgi:hypothetical protein